MSGDCEPARIARPISAVRRRRAVPPSHGLCRVRPDPNDILARADGAALLMRTRGGDIVEHMHLTAGTRATRRRLSLLAVTAMILLASAGPSGAQSISGAAANTSGS